MKIITEKEKENVIELNPFERYKYTIKWIADGEILYTLVKDEEVAIATVDKFKLIPIWSAPVFAEMAAIDEWKAYKLKAITLSDFESSLVPHYN
ncbi:DUF2750 domain-containing protein [Chitinophaga sp. Mgbs1]|uniref:DUF2750 domain-containing protein n=1 Tax=Chitinophaga solisilvae TaxID=1233460 RepID=A0A433W8T9_9BACT|nr:DUF2750 domain-containing protein [Chitinophaga solisilvae]NSL91249.1 DUF2750 domain-containing protein [Chitinophaga solisilvae]